jgi:3-methyladenine DNA glycosylase AlkD
MPNVSQRRSLEAELAASADPDRAKSSAWFFKTGKGDYGEGDRFLGITVPAQRKIALRYRNLPLTDIARLLGSPLHEHRFVALEILVFRYEKGSAEERNEIFEFYLSQTARINNWDLVDTSAPYIVGEHLKNSSKKRLQKLARSNSIWERRIAIVATLALIKGGDVETTLTIAEMLLGDKHDLIHKAVGWALREAGKANRDALHLFLQQHHQELPRTTLRYAIEKFPPDERKRLLAGEFIGNSLHTL